MNSAEWATIGAFFGTSGNNLALSRVAGSKIKIGSIDNRIHPAHKA
jgi:hypothetical protein